MTRTRLQDASSSVDPLLLGKQVPSGHAPALTYTDAEMDPEGNWGSTHRSSTGWVAEMA